MAFYVVALALLLTLSSAQPDNVRSRSSCPTRTGSLTSCRQQATFRAAVYEHAVVLPPKTDTPVTRQRALEDMEANLVTYTTQVEAAREKGVDILVFPEDGLYGYQHTRATIYPYLEEIPDPSTIKWSPCNDPSRYPTGTEVLVWMSCLARNNSLFVVINMGDKVPCDATFDTKCPSDGHYQFNTAVAFGPDGTILAKYHKTNLYYEYQFDMPDPKVAYFDTPFGRFGFLICFDVLFKEPAIPMLTDYGIKNVVFPTAWMDSLPLLSAVGYHSSFARGHSINFLAANLHIPDRRFQGSGIYTSDGMEAYYYNRTLGSGPRLLVADLNVLDDTSIQSQSGQKAVVTTKDNVDDVDAIDGHEHIKVVNSFVNNNINQNQPFTNLNYTFVQIDNSSKHAKVCRNQVCCYVTYTYTDTSSNDMFVLGAFDGLFHNKYYFQACTVLPCSKARKERCGAYTFESHTVFDTLTITAEMNSSYVLPQVLLKNGGQIELPDQDQWLFSNSSKTLKFVQDRVKLPLLEASLIGRHYDRTPVVVFG